MIKQSFGDTLRHFREEKRLTQEELALEADIAFRFVQEMEYGEKQPTITTLFKLARALEITPGELMQPVWEAWQQETENNSK